MNDEPSGQPTIRRIDGEYGIRQASGAALVIEYLVPVLEQIRGLAADAYRAVPHGGLEIGGVLFGRHTANLLQITALRELASEHAFGPAFVLSERDEAALQTLIESPAHDPELAGLEPVGWYRSRTRGDDALPERDRELHGRYFPEPWQVALVLKPAEGALMRAAFFSRDADGVFREEPDSGEFTLEPVAKPKPQPAQQRQAAAPQPRADETPPSVRETAPAASLFATVAPEPETAQAGRHMRARLLAAAGAVVFAVGFGAGAWMTSGRGSAAPEAQPSLGLRVHDADGQLLVTWERASETLANAKRAVLEIVDAGGYKVAVPLNSTALRGGTFTYARRGPSVDVGLTVYPEEGQAVREYASFLGRTPTTTGRLERERDQAVRARDEANRRRKQADADNQSLRRTVQAQSARISQLEEANRILRRRAQLEENLRRQPR